MNIYYFFPWNKNRTIDLKNFKNMDYARGFYDPFDDRRLGYLGLFRRCYDLIILSNNKGGSQVEFKVNLRMSAFKQIISSLQKVAKINLVKLKSANDIIWR